MTSAHAVLLGMLHEGFAQAYGERLEPEVTAAAERLVASAARYLVERPGPLCGHPRRLPPGQPAGARR
ncbi:MAG: hypothetical protein R2716_05880 [Microthrixaceae bacterium]